ncbi:hypothetical protein Dsin_001116 [Dipteronia sinensis]|uniref:Uncharacterized protein n=1 Tax=Dipteronia sinensis TaxID=43782 RepID=A0AAE0B4P8_9ROSI|nr:hypothetical protein Dsin_001116 [Dipteronia sinensis]
MRQIVFTDSDSDEGQASPNKEGVMSVKATGLPFRMLVMWIESALFTIMVYTYVVFNLLPILFTSSLYNHNLFLFLFMAVEEMTKAMMALKKQAVEISQLKKELERKKKAISSASASESKLKTFFKEKLRQRDATEVVLRKVIAIAETKINNATTSLTELAVKNTHLEANLAKAIQRCAELEQKLSLAEQAAASQEVEARATKEVLAASQQSMTEAQQGSEEAKLCYERLTGDLRQQKVSMEVLSQEARLALEVQSIDHYNRSPAFEAVMLMELERGLAVARMFFGGKERSSKEARYKWDRTIEKHKAESLNAIKNQRMR